ncbi:MAG: DUF4097 family beta strand repeat-containing protein [Melioribacteraceae bacterium]|nr:DUF4097 family beta strand repeat-containing protein [Melioribacteraceae bacterium]
MTRRIISNLFILLLFVGNCYAQDKPLIKTFPASAGEILELRVDPGNIDVKTWDKNEVKIEVVSKKKYEIEDLVAEKSGSIIKFFLELEDGWKNSVTVNVHSPSKFNFDLRSTGGNISLEDKINGSLKANTEGGNVSFQDIVGEVEVNTSGGNISGENVNGMTSLHTKGGNISLGNVKGGKADVNTYGGNISVGDVDSDLSAKTHGGNLSIGNVGGNAQVFTYGGHISLDKVSGSAEMETYGGHLSLEGASGEVVAKTMGGHISLEDITGSIEASTKGGHVSAELNPNPNTSSSLETTGGHMDLKIPANAKATIEVFIENDELEDEDPKDILKSDFPAKTFEVDKDAGELKATYVLNGGGAEVSMKVLGGKVKIEKWK